MGWLTVQPKSATIKTTPIDRLATGIAETIMEEGWGWSCDYGHMRLFSATGFQLASTRVFCRK